MEGGPPGFIPGFTCPALLRKRIRRVRAFRLRGFYPVPPAFPCRFGYARPYAPEVTGPPDIRPYNTHAATPRSLYACKGLGSCAFARRYSRNLG